jgi:hypothetical protein
VHIEDAKGTRIGLSAATKRPGIPSDDELIPRDISCIEPDLEEFALAIVDLSVKQYPTLLVFVPILS